MDSTPVSCSFGVPKRRLSPLREVQRVFPESNKRLPSHVDFVEYVGSTERVPARISGPMESPRLATILSVGAAPQFDHGGPGPSLGSPLSKAGHLIADAEAGREAWRAYVEDHLLCGSTAQFLVDKAVAVSSGREGAGGSKPRVLFADPTLSQCAANPTLAVSLLVGLKECDGVDVDVADEPDWLFEEPAEGRRSLYEGCLLDEARCDASPEEIQERIGGKKYDLIVLGGLPQSEAAVLTVNKLMQAGWEPERLAIVLDLKESLSSALLKNVQLAKLLDTFTCCCSWVDSAWLLAKRFVEVASSAPEIPSMSSRLQNCVARVYIDPANSRLEDCIALAVGVDVGATMIGGPKLPDGLLECKGIVQSTDDEDGREVDLVFMRGSHSEDVYAAVSKRSTRFILVAGGTAGDHLGPEWYVFDRSDVGDGAILYARLPAVPTRSSRPGKVFADVAKGVTGQVDGTLNIVVHSRDAGDAVGWRDFDPSAHVFLCGEWSAPEFLATQDALRHHVHDGHLSVVNGSDQVAKYSRISGHIDVLDLRCGGLQDLLRVILVLVPRCSVARILLPDTLLPDDDLTVLVKIVGGRLWPKAASSSVRVLEIAGDEE